ncbi:MAG TPA: RsmD family RNA methyltransferase [Chitinophagaceae bacterium]|jgi:16S rRNA (guanine(966)-N(2))-methyltransferase RsmD|nr:RsmD family RNA methyltransferase [Chitinophagaceae bacterium]
MRIISGELGGRKINPPNKMPYTRPTTDIAKEGLFNILENNLAISQLKTLDLFGGTGSISYELASRGATDQTIVEKDQQMYEFIQKTAKQLGLANLRTIKMDVFKFINQCTEQFDFIFAGPPYALTNIDDLPKLIFEKKLLKPKGWFVLEHTPRNDYKKFSFYKTERNYGTTVFSIFIEDRE